MVLARIIIAMPLASSLFYRLGKYGTELEVFTLGMLCGFPVGAKSAVFLYENGRIGKKRAEFICAFTNNASVTCLIGYIGITLFSDIMVGVKLVLFQLAASAVTALVLGFVFMKKEDFTEEKRSSIEKKGTSLNEAVIDSTYTMLSVCAFIITFSVLGETVLALTAGNGFFMVLARGFFEFSSGCAFAADMEPAYAFAAVSLLVGFSGLCVIMQVLSVIRGVLSARMYILGRLINTVVFASLALLFGIS